MSILLPQGLIDFNVATAIRRGRIGFFFGRGEGLLGINPALIMLSKNATLFQELNINKNEPMCTKLFERYSVALFFISNYYSFFLKKI